jgi:hypothetical protein
MAIPHPEPDGRAIVGLAAGSLAVQPALPSRGRCVVILSKKELITLIGQSLTDYNFFSKSGF